MTIPAIDETDSGHVGKWIHSVITQSLKQEFSTVHSPDLQNFGIEIKTTDKNTKSAISIGYLTLDNILCKPYKHSNIFEKLQCLLIVERTDIFREITKVNLHYLDNDEIQLYLEKSYNEARNNLIDYVFKNVKNEYGFEFKPYQRFKGEYGSLEVASNGTGFQFRIEKSALKFLTNLNTNSANLTKFVESA
jgi:hypothetical protein